MNTHCSLAASQAWLYVAGVASMAYGRTVHCRATASERCATQRDRPLLSAAASAPLETLAATLGVPERGDGVRASAGVHRGVPGRGAHSTAPF